MVGPSVIGDGWGLDHVILVVPNAGAVKDVFATKLGFTPFDGNNSPVTQAADAIRNLGVEVTLPASQTTRTPDGK